MPAPAQCSASVGVEGTGTKTHPPQAVVPTASAEITRPPRLHHCLTAARDTEDGAGGWRLL